MTLTLTAVNCPAPVVPGTKNTLASIEAATNAPPTSRQQTPGSLGGPVSSKLNRNQGAQDLGQRFGAGAHAVCDGLTLSVGVGTLKLAIAYGLATIDGLVEYAGATVDVNPNQTRNYVWLTQAGGITITTTTTKPVSNCVFIGSFSSNASAVTAVDRSGVVKFVNGQLERETADTDTPDDTPSSSWRGFTRCAGGLFYWDGSRHVMIDPVRRMLLSKSVAGGVDVTLTAFEATHRILELTGLLTANINVIVPTVAGLEYLVNNKTTGAFTVTVKTASGSGVVVGQAKAAVVYVDGTNVVRGTPDA